MLIKHLLVDTSNIRPAILQHLNNLRVLFFTAAFLLLNLIPWTSARAATTLGRYFMHDTVEDKYGVIAPWYKGQNGQFDFRVRVAAETIKRFPWVGLDKSVMAGPNWIFSSKWGIDSNGVISIELPDDERLRKIFERISSGDTGYRNVWVAKGMYDYYRYTGDPSAIAYITLLADFMLDYGLTGPEHPLPLFPVSVPLKGKFYGQSDPNGYIQLDVCADLGTRMIRAYQLTGNSRYLDAAKHWGDLFAEKCNFKLPLPPWPRYANPEKVPWSDNLTGSVTIVLEFLDELIRIGYTGQDDIIVKARDAGRTYLKDILLPAWTQKDTWGRYYWDWENGVMTVVCCWSCRYIMNHPDVFPNWKTDVRNILSLMFNKLCVNPESKGEVYSGAWAFPESSNCCKTSLAAITTWAQVALAQYGALADDEWGRELARRMAILTTYDSLENGVKVNGIAGELGTTFGWFNGDHPAFLRNGLRVMGWQPEVLGACRENHIMRSTAVVTSVVYNKGKVVYSTFDSPANTIGVLRLAFIPKSVTADSKPLACRSDLKANCYIVKKLACGDYIVTIRHDGCRNIVVEGDDPQQFIKDTQLTYAGNWKIQENKDSQGGKIHVANEAGATMVYSFVGNQVRLIGSADKQGGLADIYIDGQKQLVGVDCWNPYSYNQQVLYYKNGLANTKHQIKIVARGSRNLISSGDNIYIDGIQYSAAKGDNGFGKGGGPTGVQRMIFGYTGRGDYIDSKGNAWRPGTEFVIRSGKGTDSVESSWWTQRRRVYIGGTSDPELYRYGVHGKEFWVNVTVGPGDYYVKLLFSTGITRKNRFPAMVDVLINGKEVIKQMDLNKAAGGPYHALEKLFGDISPKNGIIEVRLISYGVNKKVTEPKKGLGEAMIQALEVGPMSELE